MTREEIQDFLAMVQATYPNYNPPNKTAAVNAWLLALEEYDANHIALAFKIYMKTDTSGFAPTPGKLIDKLQSVTQPQELNGMEAWALVSKAIRNSTYNSVAEFAKLPPLVQKAVGLPGQLRQWAMDEDYNEQVVSSNFMRTYHTVVSRDKEVAKMPVEVRNIIEKVKERSYEGMIEKKREEALLPYNNRLIERKEQ